MRVFLLEAGGDPRDAAAACPTTTTCRPSIRSRPRTRRCAGTSSCATTPTTERQRRDPKYAAGRACSIRAPATLGGCTAHNAMIFMLPHDVRLGRHRRADRRRVVARRAHAALLPAARGLPPSAGAGARCRDCGLDPTGHGWDGWLRTEKCDAAGRCSTTGACWRRSRESAFGAAARSVATPVRSLRRLLQTRRRPERPAPAAAQRRGPLLHAALDARHRRIGTRERLLDVARPPSRPAAHRARRAGDARAVRRRDRAIGVEYRKGERLYRAHPGTAGGRASCASVAARREVILAAARSTRRSC